MRGGGKTPGCARSKREQDVIGAGGRPRGCNAGTRLGPGSGLAAKASWKGDKDGDARGRRKFEALERPGKGWVRDSWLVTSGVAEKHPLLNWHLADP